MAFNVNYALQSSEVKVVSKPSYTSFLIRSRTMLSLLSRYLTNTASAMNQLGHSHKHHLSQEPVCTQVAHDSEL